eukprot:CAMPEP_0185856884 /NCGR_PEP_ID=MMETSP1354-20130828/29222_1 /TAXON_ID=708628 /ORGANISM="Erythrolobus madagascarensis, Strain CCMP3276" /LENGTH=221 /DNA_ID=CAMNT_0028559145 /DNA_START=1687 /DNA_END=2352 /DNA_ORIENTATION=-
MQDVQIALRENPAAIVRLLEESGATERGGLTRNFFGASIERVMRAVSLKENHGNKVVGNSKRNIGADVNLNRAGRGAKRQSGRRVFDWGGRSHALPAGFRLPCVSVACGWELWWRGLGAGEYRVPPVRSLAPSDFGNLNARKELSCWRKVMLHLEERLTRARRLVRGDGRKPTELEVTTMLASLAQIGAYSDLFSDHTPRGRTCRAAQPKVTTASKRLHIN